MTAAIPLITTGLSALGGLLGNRGQKQSSSSNPNLSPEQQALYSRLAVQQQNLMQDPDLTGYQASGENDINHMAQMQQKNLMETLASRGISGPATNYAKANVDNSRFAQIAKLRQSIPLLRQQFGTQNLESGIGLLDAIKPGTTTTATSPGNKLGGLIGNGASTLAYFLGQGAFKPKAGGGTPGSAGGNVNLPPTGNF